MSATAALPPSGPIRLLLAVILLWLGVRVATLWWWADATPPPAPVSPAYLAAPAMPEAPAGAPPLVEARGAKSPKFVHIDHGSGGSAEAAAGSPVDALPAATPPAQRAATFPAMIALPTGSPSAPDPPTLRVPPAIASAPALPSPSADRWRGSAYLFARAGAAGGALTPALGGSQAMVEGAYRLAPGVEAVGRLVADRAGAEALAGVRGRLGEAPVTLALYRRQSLGDAARHATIAIAAAGDERRVGGVAVEAYAAAGLRVGRDAPLRDPERFAEGAIAARLPVGPLAIGPALWSATQRDTRRVDAGLSLAAPLGRHRLRLDWRQRVSGNATPASGPALTLGSDF